MRLLSVTNQTIISVLAANQFHLAGIRGLPLASANGLAFPIDCETLNYIRAFDNALSRARSFWPRTTDFEIVGANQTVQGDNAVNNANLAHPHTGEEPPETVHYVSPQPLLHFRLQPL